MKQLLYIAAAALTLLTGACKTNEANYRAAYETARQRETAGVDSTVYAKIRNEALELHVKVGNDSLPMKSEYVSLTKGIAPEGTRLMPRNIVVAQFKQLFNAKSLRQRLVDNGYTDAVVLQTREPLYYVVAATCTNNAEALELLKKVRADKSIPTKSPYPLVIHPANTR